MVRNASTADVEWITDLLNATPEVHEIEGREYTAEFVRSFIENPMNIILVEEEKGCILGEIWPDKEYGFVSNLAVVPEHRRAGVGRQLYAAFEAACRERGIAQVSMLVRTDNQPMHAWAESHGFHRGREFHFFEKKL